MRITPDKLHDRDLFNLEERDPNGSALDAHWHLFLAMLRVAVRSFGAPAKLFVCFLMDIAERKAAFKYLLGLEAMLRRILLIQAGADARPLEPMKICKTRAPVKAVTRRPRAPFIGKPEFLDVRFALAPNTPSRPRRRAAPGQSEYWATSFYIAARFEALLRAAEDPLPLVMRLRQHMAREQGRHATGLVVRLMYSPPRMERLFSSGLEEMWTDAMAAARRMYRGDG